MAKKQIPVSKITLLLLIGAMAMSCPAPSLAAPSLPDSPIIEIDTGGHKAKINDIFFTNDGKYLVSASDDKTVRVWDIHTGKTVRIIRGQIGQGHEGKIYAAALSPDNRWLSMGGWFTGMPEERDAIRLIDFSTGKVKQLLKGHSNVILGLAFSFDSRLLISSSADTTARIWEIKTGQCLHTLKGHSQFIYAAAF
ncbi:MAG: hypothetical protein AB1422_19645, partial [bacterium]